MADIRLLWNGGNDEHGSYRTLEGAQKAAADLVPAERSVVFWSPAQRPSDHARIRGVLAVRTPAEGLQQIEDPYGVDDWWHKLSETTRDALAADPSAPLEGEVLGDVSKHGPRAAATYWEASEEPIRFHLTRGARLYVTAITL